MSKINLRAVPVTSTVLECIEGGYSELQNLMYECQEIVDNAPEGISETQRIQTLSETADNLSASDSQPDVPECVQNLEVRYTEDRRKSKSWSRATRCSEACTLLSAAIDAMQEWLDDDENADHDDRDEVESTVNEVQELLDNAESCEFPGMMG